MDRTIKKVEFPALRRIDVTRVAAYARVSSGKDAMLHSLSAQISYYSNLIQKHPGWLYCGVYADEALTGTKENRDGFQRLLAACRNGGVDMVITKSISRFARNTVTLLDTIRELKCLGVDVFFEEQNIHTMSSDGELMLSILASYAQEESRSASENQKWRIRKNFENGLPWNSNVFGYRQRDGRLIIVPEEAAVVRDVYTWYLQGMGIMAIVNQLREKNILNRFGGQWTSSGVAKMLSNYTYTGSLLLQRRFRTDYITKRSIHNQGELPKYHVEGSHEAIIAPETYEAVQHERERRNRKFGRGGAAITAQPFSRMIRCGCCGKSYVRKTVRACAKWMCDSYDKQGKAACPRSKAIPEDTLMAVSAEVLGLRSFDGKAMQAHVEFIEAHEGNRLVFFLKNGTSATAKWNDRSRSESWTAEMRKAAGQAVRGRNGNA